MREVGRLALAAGTAFVALIVVYIVAIMALVEFAATRGGAFALVSGLFSTAGSAGIFAMLMVAFHARFSGRRLLLVVGLLVGGIALVLFVASWYYRPTFEVGSDGIGAVSGGIAEPFLGIALTAVVVSMILAGVSRLRSR